MNEYSDINQPEQAETPFIPCPPPPKPKKNRTGLLIIVVALCFSLLGSALGAGITLWLNREITASSENPTRTTKAPSSEDDKRPDGGNISNMLEGQRENSVIDIHKIDTSKLLTAAEVYALNVNSTVGITTSITTNFWGFQSTSAASGSGFIITQDGYILTNQHVIEDSDSITVTLYNGDDYEADLIGCDESNDIAVIKIDAEGLVPVVLGDSDNLNVGDEVIAIGNPLGELTFSLTAGRVSAKDREVTFSNGVTMDLIQTDCAINSGNSGGALFNMYGEVIGVTNAKYSGNSGNGTSIDNIGFAIPLNSIRNIVQSIIEKGYISKPYLGISVIDVDEQYAIYGLPIGAAVQTITKDSPAEKAGLKIGDIITKIGTKDITCGADLVDIVAASQPDDKLVLTLYRAGTTMEITVEVGEQLYSSTNPQQNPKPDNKDMK